MSLFEMTTNLRFYICMLELQFTNNLIQFTVETCSSSYESKIHNYQLFTISVLIQWTTCDIFITSK